MPRLLTSVAFASVAFVWAAPVVNATETFALNLASSNFSAGGNGTILLAADPGNGTFAFTDYNPTINFVYNGITFTQNEVFDPAGDQFILSDLGGQRQFQFTSNNGFVSFDKDLGGGNFFEVSFRPDTYSTSAEIPATPYSALTVSADVPEPGSVAALAAGLLTGVGFLRKRRASRAC